MKRLFLIPACILAIAITSNFSHMQSSGFAVTGCGTNLWLEISAVTNGVANVVLHNVQQGEVYELMSKASLTDPAWNPEQALNTVTNQDWIATTVSMLGRTSVLSLQARDWTGVTENGNTTPDWWFWENFGTLALSDTNLDNSGNTLLYDYQNGINLINTPLLCIRYAAPFQKQRILGVVTPTNQIVCTSQAASFTAMGVSGSPTPVQWQVSTNGVTFNNISGETNATLTFPPSLSDNGKLYCAVFNDAYGSVTSSPATLTVQPPTFSINIVVAPAGVNANSVGNTASVSPLVSLNSFSFNAVSNGIDPCAGLIQGRDGNFYGTTSAGGLNSLGNDADAEGTVFKITPSGSLTTYECGGTNCPMAGLVQGNDGNFYGTTDFGGSNNAGTVFDFTPGGLFTTLYAFTEYTIGQTTTVPYGQNPIAGLVQGNDGNFYGTTSAGGTNGGGTVFRITTNGVLTTLYSFGGLDGVQPSAGLVLGSDGNFYGTTAYGGKYWNCEYNAGVGTVFKITPSGSLTTLYSFDYTNNGAYPLAGLVQGSDGNLYGTTSDGALCQGTVFKITTNGSSLMTLYRFGGTNDGGYPTAGLVQGSDGNLYGTTTYGGVGWGTVFKITTNGVLTTLYSFGGRDGAYPHAGLVQGRDGNFYGTTENGGMSFQANGPSDDGDGTVFKISSLTYNWSIINGTITGGQGTSAITWAPTPGSTNPVTLCVTATNVCDSTACGTLSSCAIVTVNTQ